MNKTFLYLGILGSLWFGLPESGIAQNLIILQGKATVPILNENLVHAEEKAILLAKKTILKNLLSQSIASPILKQAQKLIDTEILNKPDRFIESIRILNSKDSRNLTKFSIVLEARIFQSKLLSALISTDQKIGSAIQVRLTGFTTPEQETVFVENVLKPSRLRQFHLYKLAKDYAIYQGFYSGNRQSLLSQLKKTKSPLYRIKKIQWHGNQLEIQVQWIEKPTPLETYQPVEVVEQWLETNRIPTPQKKVPSERVKTTYALPQSVAVYVFLRSRGDSTLYKIEWAQPGETVKGTWHRIDKTNLTPLLSIYDAQRHLVEQHTPQWEGGIDFQYQLPKNQSYFYIRISDQIGHIEGEAGSYLSMHYVLKVSSQKKKP